MAFLLVVGWRLLRVTPFMAFAWISIAIMATFLHIYEAMFVSLALALMSGLSLAYPTKYRSQK